MQSTPNQQLGDQVRDEYAACLDWASCQQMVVHEYQMPHCSSLGIVKQTAALGRATNALSSVALRSKFLITIVTTVTGLSRPGSHTDNSQSDREGWALTHLRLLSF